MRGRSLEERLQRVEDILEIQDVMNRYATYINKGWAGKEVQPDMIPTVFAEDATFDAPEMGHSGRGAAMIGEGMAKETQVVEFSMHIFLNPVLQVDGDTASGNWLMWIAVKRELGTRFVFMSYDLTFSRTPDGWRIQTLLLNIGAMIPQPDAWLASQMPLPPPASS